MKLEKICNLEDVYVVTKFIQIKNGLNKIIPTCYYKTYAHLTTNSKNIM